MSLWIRGYAIGIAGFLYGIVGYGLSIFTYILGAIMGPAFFELVIKLVILKPSIGTDTTVLAQGLNPRHSRRPKKRSSQPSKIPQRHGSDLLAVTHANLVPDDVQLRRVASLGSFRAESSLALVAPVITIDHVDRIDNMSIKAPTITLYPGVGNDLGEKYSSKRRSATISHQNLTPHYLSSTEDSPVGRVSNLEPSWNRKSRIHRSASSPQLVTLVEKELSTPGLKQKEKIHSNGRSGKGDKRVTRQEKTADSVTYQTPPSRFFSTFPNVVKRRSQTSRTQPYNEPYCVPLPVPPISPEHLKSEKKFKRSRTFLPEESWWLEF